MLLCSSDMRREKDFSLDLHGSRELVACGESCRRFSFCLHLCGHNRHQPVSCQMIVCPSISRLPIGHVQRELGVSQEEVFMPIPCVTVSSEQHLVLLLFPFSLLALDPLVSSSFLSRRPPLARLLASLGISKQKSAGLCAKMCKADCSLWIK